MVKSQVKIIAEGVKAGRHKFLSPALLTFPNSTYTSSSRSLSYSPLQFIWAWAILFPDPLHQHECLLVLADPWAPIESQGHFTYQQRNLEIIRLGNIWVQTLTLPFLAVCLPKVKIILAKFEFLHLQNGNTIYLNDLYRIKLNELMSNKMFNILLNKWHSYYVCAILISIFFFLPSLLFSHSFRHCEGRSNYFLIIPCIFSFLQAFAHTWPQPSITWLPHVTSLAFSAVPGAPWILKLPVCVPIIRDV